ncbi:TIGR01244 family sulfur transferase [Pontixanthobacter luteolus]|uniref:TIGR01244 family sulfur transferase n=1 Tax=Pontixanthobacter luteolus TaxID=295089 RepID=UPI002FE398A3
MDIRTVDQGFAVAPQFQPAEMQTLADAGYVAVICNRPDGEEEGQPTIADMRAAAQDAGLAFHHIPVWGGQFPEAAVAAFGAVRRGTDGPLLAYCRTGTRSITLDTLANTAGLDADGLIERAASAGYDLSQFRDRLGK